ncbi:aldehyde dehydrogenase family protein [Phenylobacterium montanum]|uniref:Aldehyde dehydrogenase family protein n=1 Tax=Phenylobacterium montanum TaxID=2823693 RepID=A0A975IX48_9CAUL|nr:aldehyde dehydrogenase family protein [Caulobacter sp. S6]QUD90254.1 aldehyde dehydrogenase family protein [Caulobacter sp. S6]
MGDLLQGERWSGCYFDGEWRKSPTVLAVTEPASGRGLGDIGVAPAERVASVAEHAAQAQADWGTWSADRRGEILHAAADSLRQNAPEILSWLGRETGGVVAKCQFELQGAGQELRHSAAVALEPPGVVLPSPDGDRLSMAQRTPLGVVGVITPWNFPLLLAMRSVAPALALGNAVVLKPDPHTPVTGGVLLARIFETAGLPPGVLSVLPGGAEVGEALLAAPAVRMVTFTGSTAVGRRVGELGGRALKKVALELGGKSPLIILDDCDLDLAASAGAFASFFHQGQICMAAGRHVVLRSVADAYVERLAARARRLKLGDPLDPQTAIGPIINERQLHKIDNIIREAAAAGATVVAGGAPEGRFYRPTVLAGVRPDMRAYQEEIFGPVAVVVIAEDDDHAVAIANDTEYGLAAAVQTGSLDRGLRMARRLRAGQVHVNDQTVNDRAEIPMGGMKQSGNGSRFGSLTAWDEFTEWQWTTLGGAQVAYPF